MRRALLWLCLLLFTAAAAAAQEAPPAYVLPAGDRAIVVLGDAPATVQGFQVYRKARRARSYELRTPEPVAAAEDPYEAVQMMGSDFRWISRKLDSMDPVVVWRKLRMDRNIAQAYALLSHGLRRALGRTWVDTEVEAGRRYDYQVILLNSSGEELQRYEKRIRITAPQQPPAPPEVRAEYADGIVSIDWEYPAFRGGEEDRTVGFIVLRRRQGESFQPLSAAPVLRIEGYLSAFDDTVRIGETYTYAVVAQDIIGVISPRTESGPLAIEDTSPPLVPVGLQARDRGDDVLVIWKMSPELDVSHYDIFRSLSVEEEAGAKQLNRQPIPYQSPRFVDENAPRGVPVYYRVSAVDRRGNRSPLSGPAPLLAEDTEPPGAVLKLSATVNEEARIVKLTWQGPRDADLSGYHVYSGPDAAKLMRITAAPLPPEKRTRFSDSGYEERGLEPGRSLVYGVSAVDTSYNESPREVIEVQIPDNVAPGAPAGFAARPTREGAVRLTWQPVLCFDLAGYRVYRSAARKFTPVAELEPELSQWLDSAAERGREYRYYLTAVDASGNESKPSATQTIVPTDITPPQPPARLSAALVRRGVRLEWEAPADNDVTAYRVYRSQYPGGKPTQLLAALEGRSSYVDRRGEAGFVYGVSCVDTSGNEGLRQEVQAK
jgi:fibronectin type 3 domain-containing protein